MWRRLLQSSLPLTPQRGCVRVVTETETFLDFRDVPTPKRIPVFGTTLDLLAAGSAPKLHHYVNKRHAELGPIYRETIGSVDAVFIADPGDMRGIFNREGKYPKHVLPEAWVVYNRMYGCSRGLFFMDGEEWLHFRRVMNKLLLKSDSMHWLHEPCEHVASTIVQRWQTLFAIDEKCTIVHNLEGQLYRFSIDTMIAVLLGNKYAQCQQILEEDVEQLSSIVHLIFKSSAKLQLIPAKIAALFKLPVWRQFVESADNGLQIAYKLTKKIIHECPRGNGLVSKMMDENLSEKDIARIVADLILAAGDTTAYSMQWSLYLLAKHEDVQENLIKNCSDETSYSNYMKSIIREALRLYPVAPFLTRILPQDSCIAGYMIPQGTLIIMSLYSSSRNEKYFYQPDRFWPERWLRNGVKEFTGASPNASLPFAMGSRSCIGRKIAEKQMHVALTQITNKFSLSLMNENEIEMILRMVSVPSAPILLKLTPRN